MGFADVPRLVLKDSFRRNVNVSQLTSLEKCELYYVSGFSKHSFLLGQVKVASNRLSVDITFTGVTFFRDMGATVTFDFDVFKEAIEDADMTPVKLLALGLGVEDFFHSDDELAVWKMARQYEKYYPKVTLDTKRYKEVIVCNALAVDDMSQRYCMAAVVYRNSAV